MGGTMRVVIREKDGSVWSNTRWTNAMPGLTRSARFIDDEDAHFEAYKAIDAYHSDDHTLAPVDYGILVVDRMNNFVIDCNAYGTALQMGAIHLHIHPEDEDYLELMRRGLLMHKGQVLEVPAGMTRTQYVETLYREDEFGTISIKCDPWSYRLLEDGDYDEVRRVMLDLGFVFTARDQAAFQAAINNRNRDDEEDDAVDIDEVLAGMPKTDVDLARDAASATPAKVA